MRGGPIRGSKRLAAFLDRVGPRSFASLRERPVTFAGSFVALCLGVAILTMSALVLLSGGSGVPERFAGTPLVVQSGQGSAGSGVFLEKYPFSPERADELKRELAALPGVSRAIPDHAFYAQALIDGKPAGEQTKGDRLGHGWSSAALAPYRLAAGQARGSRTRSPSTGPWASRRVPRSRCSRPRGPRSSPCPARSTDRATTSPTPVRPNSPAAQG